LSQVEEALGAERGNVLLQWQVRSEQDTKHSNDVRCGDVVSTDRHVKPPQAHNDDDDNR